MRIPRFLRIAVRESLEDIIFHRAVTEGGIIVNEEDSTFVHLLSQILGFSYELIVPEDRQYGHSLSDGNWTGMIGEVYRESTDLAIGKLAVTEERNKVVSFTAPYHVTDITFLTDQPENLPKSLAIYYPFSLIVWISIIATFFLINIVAYMTVAKKYSLGNVFIKLFGCLLEQSVTIIVSKLYQRLVILSWIVCVMFLTYSYKAVFLSYLTLPPVKGVYTIQQLKDAVTHDGYQCFTYKGSYITESLSKSPDLSLQVIGENIEKQSRSIDFETFWKNPTKRTAFIGSRSDFYFLEEAFLLSQDNIFSVMVAVALQKSFCCARELDIAIYKLNEAGIYDKILKDLHFIRSLKYSLIKSSETDFERKLSLDDISGAFYFFFAGHTLALCTGLIEILHKNFQTRKI